MFGVKILAAVFFLASVITGGSSSCKSGKTNSQPNSMDQTDSSMAELKVIAEGSVSQVKTPFVAVVRDGATYAALRAMSPNLPELNPQFFQSSLVIAAFLGERNTGGYGIAISREANGQIRVSEKAPRKDAIVVQMITSPFKIVSMATNGTPPVQLSLDERFRQTVQLYRISNGSFSISGGFAGRTEQYKVAGKLQVMRLSSLVTIGFAIVSEGTARERALRDIATGLATTEGVALSRLSHGSLVDTPSGDLSANAKFVENRLLIDLTTGVVTVPDGYSGKGTIEAQMVAASAN